jgi:recombinational DNA repair protein (RecF pathway)
LNAARLWVNATLRIMPARQSTTSLAIVTSRFRLGEADRVLTLLSATRGKFKAIARARKIPTTTGSRLVCFLILSFRQAKRKH